jgi:alpha/beta superfamily hydrolase
MSQLDCEELLIDGPVGKLHLLLDHPSTLPKGGAIVSHPQPLLGGSPRHIFKGCLSRAAEEVCRYLQQNRPESPV